MTSLKTRIGKLMEFIRRERRTRELDEEINIHLAMEIRQRIERGESPEEARLNARREFGNLALIKDTTRDVWGQRWLDEIVWDFAYALRILRRHWKVTAIAIISLSVAMAVGVI